MKREVLNKIMPWIWVVCILGIWSLFLWNRIDQHLDSDMSSELMLGNILSKDHGFFSDKWFYSTELRVLNTQLVYQLVFAFSDNWHVVRCVSSVLMTVMLLGCFYYLMNQIGCKESFPFLAPLLIWNYSDIYFHQIAKSSYYITHICISFLTIGMLQQFINSVKRRQKHLLAVFMALLALFAGMGGPRQILVLYLPILLSSVVCFALEMKNGAVHEKMEYIFLCVVNLCFSVAGYFINSKILSQKYEFMAWDAYYKDFSLESLVNAFNGILRTFGYTGGKIFSFATMINGCMFVVVMMTVLSIYVGITRKIETSYISSILSFYLLCAVIIYVLLYAFTDMPYSDRYNLPILIFVIPVIAVIMREIKCNPKGKKYICTFVIFMLYIFGLQC